jgi:dihydrolipoamide dehydrogenase
MEQQQKKFDLVVLGSGPGGYPAAIRAAQNGKKVALIEAKELGGTCLNRGCIPSKTLIAGAEVLHRINEANEFGISVENVTFDFSKLVSRKNRVVEKIRTGLQGLLTSNQITIFQGFGKFISPTEIKIIGKDNIIITTEKTIIATGSEPRSISAFPFDYKKIHDSTSLLELKELPKSIVIVGGGIIGCEFASLYNIFGVDVTIVEMMSRIIPMENGVVSDALTKAFHKKGIKIVTDVSVQGIDTSGSGVVVKLANGNCIAADLALVSVGRLLNTQGIGLEKAGVVVNDDGTIPVNSKMETNVPGIYAIGDIASKWWLAHVATHQGLIAAGNASGQNLHMHYNAIPSVIYTVPEIATIGLSVEAAKEKGYKAAIGAFPFQALGKSEAAYQTDGFAQIVIDQSTGQVLGAQVVGYEASALIAEMAIVITNELTVECITETIHAHPTISEAWLESALISNDTPLHMPPRPKQTKKPARA